MLVRADVRFDAFTHAFGPDILAVWAIWIGVLHSIIRWAIASAVGVSEAQRNALGHLAASDIAPVLIDTHLGPIVSPIILVLLVVSVSAAIGVG